MNLITFQPEQLNEDVKVPWTVNRDLIVELIPDPEGKPLTAVVTLGTTNVIKMSHRDLMKFLVHTAPNKIPQAKDAADEA